jgi:hypothetical protein
MTRRTDRPRHPVRSDAGRRAAAGADAADAIAVDGASLSVDVLNGRLEQAERAEGVEIGLRVMVGQRQASVSASDTRPETLREMAERAVGMARLAPEDPTVGLADPGMLSPCGMPTRSTSTIPPSDPLARAGGRRAARRSRGARRQGHLPGAIRQRRVLAAAHPPCRKQRLFRWLRAQQPRSVLRRHHRRRPGDGAGLFRRQPHPCRRPDGRRGPSVASPPSVRWNAPARASRRPAPSPSSITNASRPA